MAKVAQRPVLEDTAPLVREILRAIDGFLFKEMDGKEIAAWSNKVLSTYVISAQDAMIDAALTVLSFLGDPQASVDLCSERLESIKAALEGKEPFVMSALHVPSSLPNSTRA